VRRQASLLVVPSVAPLAATVAYGARQEVEHSVGEVAETGSRPGRAAPVVLALLAGAAGLPFYLALDVVGALPLELRDSPWPLEALAAALALASMLAARRSPRGRWRAVGVAASLAAAASTLLFSHHVRASYRLPPSSAAVRLGVRPPALDLKDEQGRPFSLEVLRGVPAVLILFRGAT